MLSGLSPKGAAFVAYRTSFWNRHEDQVPLQPGWLLLIGYAPSCALRYDVQLFPPPCFSAAAESEEGRVSGDWGGRVSTLHHQLHRLPAQGVRWPIVE